MPWTLYDSSQFCTSQIATTKYNERRQIILPCIDSGQQQETFDTTVPSPLGETLCDQLLVTARLANFVTHLILQ